MIVTGKETTIATEAETAAIETMIAKLTVIDDESDSEGDRQWHWQ